MFNWSIIQSLRLLKSLKTLSLTDNRLEVSFPVEGMPIHHNTYNSYFSLFFFFLVELLVFEDLEILDLSNNQLNGSLTVQGREIEKIIFLFN